MKQRLFKVFALLLTLIAVMSLVACGGGDSAKDGLGGTTWALSGGTQGDITVDKETLESVMGGEMTFAFADDGTVTMSMSGVEGEGTWTQDGTQVTIESDGEAKTLTLDGDKMTLEQDGITIEFTKK